MKPVLKKIICKVDDPTERTTDGGIVLPECHTKDQVIMEVVSVGAQVEAHVADGDKVLVSGFQGHDITVDGVKYKVIDESQILAVL